MVNKSQLISGSQEVVMNTTLVTNTNMTVLDTEWFDKGNYFFVNVVNGTLDIKESPETNNQQVIMRPGSYVMLQPYSKIKNVKPKDCTLRVTNINPDFLKSVCDFISPDMHESVVSSGKPIFFNLSLENMYCMENCCEQYNNCCSPEWQEKMAKGIMTLLINLMQFPKDDEFSKYPPIVKKILSILNFIQNIRDGIPQSIYELGYSKSYICRIFKKHVGMSITNYITDMKLKHSITILNRNNLSIAEVCEDLHFESVPYFTKIFKQKYGITPAKYRNSIPR